MIYIKPFILKSRIDEHSLENLSPFIRSYLKDLRSKLYYYDGNFKFLKDMQAKLKRDGQLTEKQWQGIYNSFYHNK